MTNTSDAVTLDIGGAQLTVQTHDLFRAWLDRHLNAPAASIPANCISIPSLNVGEHYAGIIIGEGGDPSHHLILLPSMAAGLTWQQATDWAKENGGDLPTRREQSLLYANLKDQFEPEWYWSGAQHASYSGSAWCQSFGNGGQDGITTNFELRARAVRRLIIQ